MVSSINTCFVLCAKENRAIHLCDCTQEEDFVVRPAQRDTVCRSIRSEEEMETKLL
jgi:hypothetical protein